MVKTQYKYITLKIVCSISTKKSVFLRKVGGLFFLHFPKNPRIGYLGIEQVRLRTENELELSLKNKMLMQKNHLLLLFSCYLLLLSLCEHYKKKYISVSFFFRRTCSVSTQKMKKTVTVKMKT